MSRDRERTARRMCYDRLLPGRPRRLQRTRMPEAPGRNVARAIAPQQSVWVNGSRITVHFMEGSDAQISMVQEIAPRWTQHANLGFAFVDDPSADVRITFDPLDGAWSYVGTDGLSIPYHAATMNLGWLDQGVILHEFGHMIGLGHEHQNPDGGIVWNEEKVIEDLKGPPNYWTEQQIRHNVLEKYAADQIHGTSFDDESIMLYAFPDDWTENMPATQENDEISAMDRDFVRSGDMYPGRQEPDDAAAELQLGAAVEGAIAKGGEEDLYRLDVSKGGVHEVETSGGTDVVLALFGPGSPTRLVDRNDDGGVGLNARVVAYLEPGTYYAQVRHYWPDATGEYSIVARAL